MKIATRPAEYIAVNASGEAECPTCNVLARATLDRYKNIEWRGCQHAIGVGSNGTVLTIGFVED